MRTIVIISLLAAAIFTACTVEREKPPTPEETVRAMQEYIMVAKIFSDSFDEASDAGKESDEQLEGKKGPKSDFPIITIEPFDLVTWPKTITADYGTTNYLCLDGRYRRGKIVITASDFYRNEGAEYVVNFENYYQNDHKVEGTQTVTNSGRNNDGFLVYGVVITNGKITTPESKVVYFNQNSTRTWTEGESTVIQPCDDVYLIAGTQDGVSSDSIHYTITVPEDLNVLVCCKWVRSGILNINIEELPTISIDYGETNCDNQATISFGGNTYPVNME